MEPLTPITLENASKQKFAFRPQADMTAIESALLSQLFAKLVLYAWRGTQLDWPTYLDDYKLWRHFTPALGSEMTEVQKTYYALNADLDTPDKLSEERQPMIVIEHVDSEQRRHRVKIRADMPIPDNWSLVETLGAGEVR